ncbi:uncharacterized protein [Henckelia pumila]|uniref:uncharacterized protein n=1 Tax=Henckelia pumila TaxID=405737 RepID=UPI003C6E01DD
MVKHPIPFDLSSLGRKIKKERKAGNKEMQRHEISFGADTFPYYLVSLGARNDQKHRGVLRVEHWQGFGDVTNLTGSYKLNSDGCSKEGGESGIGGIIRDYTGYPIIAYHESIGLGTNTRAELSAILKGLQIFSLYNLFPLWLEVDSMAALAIIDADATSWELSPLLTQIQWIMHNSNVHNSHVFTEANAVADEMTNMRLGLGAATLQLEDIQGRLKGLCRLNRSGLPYIRV